MTDTDKKPPINTDEWTPKQKNQIMRTLFSEHVGLIELDVEKGAGLLPFEQEVYGNSTACIQMTPYMLFKPQRLIIFEPTVLETILDTNEVSSTVKSGQLWWKKTTTEIRRSHSTSLVARKTPRSSWRITQAFVGNQSIWPNSAAQPGEAFGIENALPFDAPTCNVGLTISLGVRNLTDKTQTFVGVMVGKYLRDEMKLRAEDSVRNEAS